MINIKANSSVCFFIDRIKLNQVADTNTFI